MLRIEARSSRQDTARYGTVDLLHSTAVQGQDRTVTLFAVNRATDRPLDLTADLRTTETRRVVSSTTLADADRQAGNSRENPGRVRPRTLHRTSLEEGTLAAELPPLSWNVVRLA